MELLSADPLYTTIPDLALRTPKAMNVYAFSLNNPVRYYDPDGREAYQMPTESDGLGGIHWPRRDRCGGVPLVSLAVLRSERLLAGSDQANPIDSKKQENTPELDVLEEGKDLVIETIGNSLGTVFGILAAS